MIPFPYNLLAGALAALAMFGAGWGAGQHFEHNLRLADAAQVASDKQAVAMQVADLKTKAAELTNQVAAAAAAKIEAAKTKATVITKEVKVYVSPKADAVCTVAAGFVRITNAAASGEVPVSGAAGSPDGAAAGTAATPATPEADQAVNDAASGYTLSQIAESVTENYGLCNAIREQLIGLQGWITQEQALALSP